MERLVKNIKKSLFWSIFISILFVVGIPLIPIFAGKNWVIMALGIICVVVGFYGSPFVWIKFGLNVGAKKVLECITIDNMLTTREISFQLNKNEMQVKNDIFLLIRKRYLVGYIFDGEKLTLNENEKPQKKT